MSRFLVVVLLAMLAVSSAFSLTEQVSPTAAHTADCAAVPVAQRRKSKTRSSIGRFGI